MERISSTILRSPHPSPHPQPNNRARLAADDDGIPGANGGEYEARRHAMIPEEEQIWDKLEKELEAEQVGLRRTCWGWEVNFGSRW